MAVKLEAKLDNSQVLEALNRISQGFLDIVKTSNLSEALKFDEQMLKAQFEVVRLNLEKAISTGEIDVKKLGFDKLISYLTGIIKNAGKLTGQELGNAVIIPIQEGLAAIDKALNEKESRLGEIYDRQKELGTEAVKKKTKEETGFTGRVMYGSPKEAETFLKQLKEAEEEDPGGNERRWKLIEFYELYTTNLRLAAEEAKKLKQEESQIKGQMKTLDTEKAALDVKLKKESADIDKSAPDYLVKLLQLQQEVRNLQDIIRKLQKDSNTEKKEANKLSGEATDQNNKENKSLGDKAVKAFEYYTVLNMLKNVYRQSIRTITELDKAMTEAAIVTSMNREEAWKLIGTYQTLASETGLRVSELSGVVNEFLRQGRNLKDALELTRVAAMSAKVAGISAQDAVKYLTSAVNGFGLAADQAEEIADKFAAIAARSASSFQELAVAMSKVAPVAKSAGVGVDFMMGVLAKGIETTREAPENIGTAFKTIFARMREVTDIGKATEDGMSLNRVEKALESINVPLRDVSGQFRNLEDVLIDVGNKWDTLTTIEQAYLATALAGTRQQPRLLAIFNDFARTKELIQISADATSELTFQHLEYMSGMEAAMNVLKNSWETFITTIANSEIIIGTIEFITKAINALSTVFKAVGDNSFYTTIVLGFIIAKLTLSAILFTRNAISAVFYAVSSLFAAKSTVALGAASAGATPAVGALGVAVNTVIWPFTLAAVIILALVAVILIFANNANEAGKGAEVFAKKVDQLNGKLAEIDKKKDSLDGLIDKFKELNNETDKSIEQIEDLNKVTEDLSEVKYTPKTGKLKGEEQVFNLVTEDFAGNSVLNEAELARLEKMMSDDKAELERQIREQFVKSVLDKGIEATLDQQTLLNYIKKLGYDAGKEFITNFATGSDESKNKAKKALEDSLRVLDMEQFTELKPQYKVAGRTFDTRAEAEAWLATQDKKSNLWGHTFVVDAQGRTQSTDIVESTVLNTDKLENFSKTLSEVYLKFYNDLEHGVNNLDRNLSKNDKMKESIRIGLREYQEALDDIQAKFDSGELSLSEYTAAVEVVGASLNDQRVLTDLIENKKIDLDVIANLSVQGLSAIEIRDYFESLFSDEKLKLEPMSKDEYFEFIGLQYWGMNMPKVSQDALYEGYTKRFYEENEAMRQAFEDAIIKATSGESGQISLGIKDFVQELKDAGYTDEEIRDEVIKLTNIIKTVSSQQAADIIKTQLKSTEGLFNLAADIAKGNFENFTELATDFGVDVVEAFMRGEEQALQTFLQAQIDKTLGDIDLAIEELIAIRDTIGLGAAEERELATLQSMREYYEDIAMYTLLRNYRLGEAKSLLEITNKLVSIQNSLLQAGVESGDFIDFLEQLNTQFTTLAEQRLGTQLAADLDRLKTFGTAQSDGSILFNVDDIDSGALRASLENYLGTLEQYISMQQQAYERYKKTITDTYKVEIDAVKSAVDEKWKQIDYANKLADAEERVLSLRKNLAALEISGAGTSAVRAAEKELKKAEEERRRMIEQKMAEEAQKQLEAERDALLLAAQEEMVAAIEGYTNQVNLTLAAIASSGEDLTRIMTNIEQPIIRQNQLQETQIDATISNTEAIINLSEVLKEQQSALNGTRVARGSGFVDTGIFLGIS